MDEDLLNQIRTSLKSRKYTHELEQEAAHTVLAFVESKFIIDPDKTWWWESIRFPSRVIAYGETNVFSRLVELIGRDEIVLLVVTDDEHRPWPVFKGPLHEVLGVIAEQRFFEYFLISGKSPNPDWMIFDTHHNQLVVTGAI
jgi:hypothetical protein